jgi:hypothetical protein
MVRPVTIGSTPLANSIDQIASPSPTWTHRRCTRRIEATNQGGEQRDSDAQMSDVKTVAVHHSGLPEQRRDHLATADLTSRRFG